MKTEKEIFDELERLKELGYGDTEVDAARQAVDWALNENVMAPFDYLTLGGKR